MSDTPRTDRHAKNMAGYADLWVPQYVCEELERELAEARSEAGRLETLITDFTGGMQCDIRPHNPDELIALKQEGYDIVKRRLSRVKGVE